jgi:hypothetical protein
MRIHHPKIKVVLIDQKRYLELEREVSSRIPLWEHRR